MKKRHIAPFILKYSKEYPVVALVGPRQSGKTTLARALFPEYKYLSLENLDLREFATRDPRGFLETYGSFVILDEIQRVPALFSYLQEIVDQDQTPAQYILTGSSQFLLIEEISQSLAGRIVTFKLYPFTYTELYDYSSDKSFETIFQVHHKTRPIVSQEELYTLLWKGLYPRIYDKQLDHHKWHENYLLTYVERDVRSLLNIRNLHTFEAFLKLCASQSGRLINYSNLANAVGVSLPTIKEWVSILETSGLIFIMPPYFENFSKRIIKTPKIFFTDTGLLCHLLSIRTIEQLKTHPLLGSIFETFLVSECYKRFYNIAEIPPLYFWRDQSGNEIDLLIYNGQKSLPIEIKLSKTFHADFKNAIVNWLKLKNNPADKGIVIYCGEHALQSKEAISFLPWFVL